MRKSIPALVGVLVIAIALANLLDVVWPGMADLVHARIKRELGLGTDQGRRYSWGYPACPDVEQHVDVLRLLAPHPDEMGMGLTSAFQLTPEQSTAAIIMHHPQATYFSARRRNRLPESA